MLSMTLSDQCDHHYYYYYYYYYYCPLIICPGKVNVLSFFWASWSMIRIDSLDSYAKSTLSWVAVAVTKLHWLHWQANLVCTTCAQQFRASPSEQKGWSEHERSQLSQLKFSEDFRGFQVCTTMCGLSMTTGQPVSEQTPRLHARWNSMGQSQHFLPWRTLRSSGCICCALRRCAN